MPSLLGPPDAGSYTPTLTNTSNLAASTAYTTYWERQGTRVRVWGRCDLDPTAAAPTQLTLRMSLPIASNIGVAEDLAGTLGSLQTAQCGGIWGDATNNEAEFNNIVNNTGNASYAFNFSYRLLP